MPTLIIEKRVNKLPKDNQSVRASPSDKHKQGVSMEDVVSSKTPKKTESTGPKQRKVTPGTTSSTKRKKGDEEEIQLDNVKAPSKKQKSLLFFFAKPKAKQNIQLSPGARTTTTLCTSTTKTVKSGIDSESLRDIVIGTPVSPLGAASKNTPEYYDRLKGSPMPTNLKQPTFAAISSSSIPCERLLDRLNKQDADTAKRTAASDRSNLIADHDDNDGENTVCFSQESQGDPGMDVEQPSSSDDAPVITNKVMDEVVEPTVEHAVKQTLIQEVIVDMTQMDNGESTDDEVPVANGGEEQIIPVKEFIVDLTQIDALDDLGEPTNRNGNDATVQCEQDSVVDTKDDLQVIPRQEPSQATTIASKHGCDRSDSPVQTEPDYIRPVEESLSRERLAHVDKHKMLRLKAMKGNTELIQRVAMGLDGESFQLPSHCTIQADAFDDKLSQQAVLKLAFIVQGSDLPLGAIANKAFELLKVEFESIKIEAIIDQIKTFFTRENYIAFSAVEMKTIDKLEDTTDRMWRWEFISPELFPGDVAAMVKKSMTVRKRIRSHSKALVNLLRVLDDTDKALMDVSSKCEHCDKLLVKVKSAEENLLKFERAFEKARLLEDLKLIKDRKRSSKLLEKEKEIKGNEITAKREEETRIKLENQMKREEEKEKKRLLAVEKKRKEEDEKIAALEKNKSRMLNFFVAKASKEEPKQTQLPPIVKTSLDNTAIWTMINSTEKHAALLFKDLSLMAIASRKRRTKMVSVSVYMTTVSDDQFSIQQPYAEQRTVEFPNKYKFLSFHEDYRPAYHGTWSKKSHVVKGHTPFAQDEEALNYDEDSEAEWEEGDDEFGEDLQDEDADGEEENIDPIEGDTRNYNFQDGWMAEDDEVVYENEEVDDETRRLRKMLKASVTQLTEAIVAPYKGGCVIDLIKRNRLDLKNCIYVNDEKQINPMALLELDIITTEAELLSHEDVCIDAFPPNLMDESFGGDPATLGVSVQGTKSVVQEMSTKDLQIFAEFVHHAAFASKDRLIEDLRMTHPTITSSRAQATRKLDSVALKKKNPCGGVIWEVNRKVLEELGLDKQLAMSIPEPKSKPDSDPNQSTALSTKKNENRGEEEMVDTTIKSLKQNESRSATKIEPKKRKKTEVSAASAALFAKFIAGGKKPKTC